MIGHSERVVVIGGVAAGMSAATRAKRVNPNLEVIVLERGSHPSYGACGLPYLIGGHITHQEQLFAYTPEYFRQERGIDLRLQTNAVQIRPSERSVLAQAQHHDSPEKIPYDYLVVATGAVPIRLPIPGVNLENIFTLRTLQEGLELIELLRNRRPRRAVVVGAGYVGVEMAESFQALGLQVTVIEGVDHLLRNTEPEISRLAEEELNANGVTILKNTRVAIFEGEKEVRRVVTDTGLDFEADLVLISAGIRPNIQLAQDAGIVLGPTGAIAVDERQETSVRRIYAAGDCCETKHIVTGHPTWIPLGPAANKQGKVVGDNVAGRRASFPGVAGTAVVKVFNLEVARTGLSVTEATKLGIRPGSSIISAGSRAGYYPGGAPVTIKVIYDRTTHQLLGAQMAGREGVAKRIDIFATALHAHMTLDDMSQLDLSYAPPFGPVWDPVLIAVNAALKDSSQ